MEQRDKLIEVVEKIFPTASNLEPEKHMNSFRLTLGGKRFRLSVPKYSPSPCFVEQVCGNRLICNEASKLLENIVKENL